SVPEESKTQPHLGKNSSIAGARAAARTETAILIYAERLAKERRRQVPHRRSQVDVVKNIQKVHRQLQRVTFCFRTAGRSVVRTRGRGHILLIRHLIVRGR